MNKKQPKRIKVIRAINVEYALLPLRTGQGLSTSGLIATDKGLNIKTNEQITIIVKNGEKIIYQYSF